MQEQSSDQVHVEVEGESNLDKTLDDAAMPKFDPEQRVIEDENPYHNEGDQRLETSFNYVPTLMNACPDDQRENGDMS